MTDNNKLAKQIAVAVEEAGGRAYFVGGYVRDKLLHIENKDIDIEVHGILTEKLEMILDSVGERLQFGKSFGVYNIKGSSIDIAMPRKEECIGNKHTDFKVDVNPFLGTKKAAERRDFTVNAIMEDVLTGEIIDHFGGVSDLKNKIIRHVNDRSFSEDPLRVLRGAQFSSRFCFEIAEETKSLCSKMDLKTISHERVFEEMKKALLKADKPSLFFRNLFHMGQLSSWFPEVLKLKGIEQSHKHHLEGNVFNHTMMVLDEAAKYRECVKNKMGFMLTALVHDFGKIVTTEVIDGEIHAYRHETEGLPVIKAFLKRLTNEKQLIDYVLSLSEHHMKPNVLALNSSGVKSTNKMFDSVAEPLDLIYIAISDGFGKISEHEFVSTEKFLKDRLDVYYEYMSRPCVTGEDLIKAGLKPGKCFSEILSYAHKLRLAGVPKESALKQTLSYARKVSCV